MSAPVRSAESTAALPDLETEEMVLEVAASVAPVNTRGKMMVNGLILNKSMVGAEKRRMVGAEKRRME